MSQMEDMIRDILDTKTYLREENGTYTGEIYADYRDELSAETIIKLFDSENPRDAFYDSLFDSYDDAEWDYKVETLRTIEENWDDDATPFCEVEDEVRDWVSDNVYYEYPYQHFFNQSVCVDILVDTGDGNYDFTRNELFGCKYSESGVKESSALVWLMGQQGYSDDEIQKFVEEEDFQNSKFLESIYHECNNTGTCMNALTFFVEMTLEELFALHDKIKANEGLITLSKDTRCGLYDPWNGAGACLEIELECDVELPVKYIDSALPDGGRGYSVDDIFGVIRKLWSYGSITINEAG